MALFVVMSFSDDANVKAALDEHYSEKYLRLGAGQYVVAGRGSTAIELSNELGISTGAKGSCMVALISGYWGFGSKNIWDWMATKANTP
jgi:hypothetical protein